MASDVGAPGGGSRRTGGMRNYGRARRLTMHMSIRALLLTVLLAVALPASAQASFKIGDALSADASLNGGGPCMGLSQPCTLLQTDSSTVPIPQYVIPAAFGHAVITSWSFKAGGGDNTLQVVRAQGTGKYVEAAHSAAVLGAGASTIATSSTRLPVQGGDAIALKNDSNALVMYPTATVNDVVQQFGFPGTAVGAVPEAPSFAAASQRLLLQATVEPDADDDGFGDDTQDLCPTDAMLHTACQADLLVNLTRPLPGVKIGQPITYTSIVANTGSSPATNVQLVLDVPGGLVASAATTAGSCAGATCALGTLARGVSATVTFTVTTTQIGALTATVAASSATADPDPANNSAAIATTVELPDLGLSRVSISAKRFHRATRLPRLSPSAKASPSAIRFTLSEAAKVKLTFARIGAHNHLTTVGSVTVAAKGGDSRLIFSGVLSKSRKLAPGRYRLTASAQTSDGRKASAKAVQFTLLSAR
jgi:uncharacterized repeat protein (TIGR01451 family)